MKRPRSSLGKKVLPDLLILILTQRRGGTEEYNGAPIFRLLNCVSVPLRLCVRYLNMTKATTDLRHRAMFFIAVLAVMIGAAHAQQKGKKGKAAGQAKSAGAE